MEIPALLILGGKIVFFLLVLGGSTVLSFIGLPMSVLFLVLGYLHHWQFGSDIFTAQTLAILTALTFLALFLDNIVIFLGLKQTQASRRGYIGALIGTFVGVFSGNFFGIVFFAFIGGILGELLHGKTQKEAFRSGLGAAISFVFGSLLRAVLTLAVSTFILYQLLF